MEPAILLPMNNVISGQSWRSAVLHLAIFFNMDPCKLFVWFWMVLRVLAAELSGPALQRDAHQRFVLLLISVCFGTVSNRKWDRL